MKNRFKETYSIKFQYRLYWHWYVSSFRVGFYGWVGGALGCLGYFFGVANFCF